MAIECGVIAALFAVIVVLFFRKKRNLWAWATLPLTLVPLCEFLLGLVFVELFSLTFSPFVRMIALMVAVACSCVWIGFISCAMKHKKKRITYIGMTNLFNILLAAILIYNILPEIPT